MATKIPNYYEVLGLSNAAKDSEIKEAFLKLSKKHHPDCNPNNKDYRNKFNKINEAYSVLRQPLSRRDYDVQLSQRFSNSSASVNSAPRQAGSFYGNYKEDTYWHYRHHKEANKGPGGYADDCYYGIRGVKKQSNATVVGFCLIIIALGFVLSILRYQYSLYLLKKQYENVDMKNYLLFEDAKARARLRRSLDDILDPRKDES